MWRHHVQYRVKYVSVYSTLYSTQVWSASEALPSAIGASVPYMSLERLQKHSLQSEVFRVPYIFLKALGSANK